MEEMSRFHIAKEHLCVGITLFLNGQYVEAQNNLKSALQQDSSLILAYCYLGIIALETGSFKDALEWCERGLEIDDSDTYLHYCYGVALEKNDFLDKAIEEYLFYINHHPEDLECWFSLGSVYERHKDFENALICFDKICVAESWNYKAFYNKATILEVMERFVEAKNTLEIVVSKNPLYWKAWVKLGLIYSQENLWEKSAHAYEQVVRLRPELSDGHYNLGLCYLSLDKSQLALKAFQEAVTLNAEDADAQFYVGLSYIELKQEEKAMNAFQKVLNINLEHEKAHYLLGCLYYLQGLYDKFEKEQTFLDQSGSFFAPLLKNVLANDLNNSFLINFDNK